MRIVRRIATGLGFLEGPVWLGDHRVLVGELVSGRLLIVDACTGAVTTFADTGGAPNGVAPGPGGGLLVANNGGMGFAVGGGGWMTAGAPVAPVSRIDPCIQVVHPDGRVEVLYTECDGNPLVAPNDLVLDGYGGFYFTDTGRGQGRLTDVGAVYYGRVDGSEIVELLRDPVVSRPPTQPNGIGLSPAGDVLYVAETGTGRLWGWGVLEPGRVGPHPTLRELETGGAGLLHGSGGMAMFDSLAVEASGAVAVATLRTGVVTVIAPEGTISHEVKLDDFDPFVTNICFGGQDLGTAYVTTGGTGSLWEVPWDSPGLALAHADETTGGHR